ncbi:hypothetical protein L596_011944 [Steinernema carpocapsae]|uniref:Uncharacterized protein n=1 Tax=Steinernema carpocapsae TaxID=34508 RepID=A0A4U5NVL8_STECR|nr:hypothetical protein L596_011944 [Steinernema carpocapsae]
MRVQWDWQSFCQTKLDVKLTSGRAAACAGCSSQVEEENKDADQNSFQPANEKKETRNSRRRLTELWHDFTLCCS